MLRIFSWITAFLHANHSATVTLNGINTLLANGVSTFFSNGKPTFINGPRSLPRNSPHSIIADSCDFDNFILVNKLLASASQRLKTFLLVSNSLYVNVR